MDSRGFTSVHATEITLTSQRHATDWTVSRRVSEPCVQTKSEKQFSSILGSGKLESSRPTIAAPAKEIVSCARIYFVRYSCLNCGSFINTTTGMDWINKGKSHINIHLIVTSFNAWLFRSTVIAIIDVIHDIIHFCFQVVDIIIRVTVTIFSLFH